MAIAKAAGCRRSSFYNWYNGATTARIDLLLHMCYELKIPLTSLVVEAIPQSEAAAVNRTAVQEARQRGVQPRRTAEQIRRALQQAATEEPAPSITDVATRLGYSTPTQLYVADSALCKMIVQNFNRSGRKH